MDNLRNLGYDIIFASERDVAYSSELDDIEVLVCYNPFNSLDISKLKKLKWIQLSSAGIDQLPIHYVKDRDIVITNNRGGYSIPMGEWVVLKILEMLKHSGTLYENQKKKLWKMDTGVLELYGKTVGFIGAGKIAQESAKRLQGFGTRILGTNTKGTETEYFNYCYSTNDLGEMLKQCDIVVLTAPYTKDTYHLINEEKIFMMKDGAYFINVARGNIVDENALIFGLKSGKIAGAALDVVEEEPLSKESPLWHMENVIVTPHNSWISENRNQRRYELIYENMKNYKEGNCLVNVIDLKKGY